MSKTPNEDRSIWQHAGLPFFYRHTPVLRLRRGAFWLGFALVAVVTLVDILLMPYPPNSMAATLRGMIFDRPGFRDFDQGLRAIFDQYFVGALILSGMIAPLYATYSLAMERVGGTIEFLRLSPMSTLSVVLGKMFAPAYLLHLFSALLLALGAVFGVAGGLAPGDVAVALLSIAATAVTVHALGGLLACATTTFRGFGAVIGLVGLGFLFYVLPSAFARVPGLGYLQYLSPFSAMNALFWSKYQYNAWGYFTPVPDQFLGYEGLVAPFVIGFHGLLVVMLVWAATRWLDHPEGTALPKKAWAFLMLSMLGLALGTVPNDDGGLSQRYINAFAGRGMDAQNAGLFEPRITVFYAKLILLVPGLVLALLAALDHPHRRELALEEACERLGNRTQAPARPWRRLLHALFVSAAATTVIVMSFGLFDTPYPISNRVSGTDIAAIAAVGFVLYFFGSLGIESAWIRFRSPGGRVVAAQFAVGLLLLAIGAPIANAVQASKDWQRAKDRKVKIWDADFRIAALSTQIETLKTLPADQAIAQAAAATPGNPPGVVTTRTVGPNGAVIFTTSTPIPQALTVGQQIAELEGDLRHQQHYRERQIDYMAEHEELEIYAADMPTREAAAALEKQYDDAPLAVVWHYHPNRLFWYPLGLLAVCALIVFSRAWTYRAIDLEAQRAVASSDAAAPQKSPAPAPAAPGSNDALPAKPA